MNTATHMPQESSPDCPLLQYSRQVVPEEVVTFDDRAPPAVRHALRTTVQNLVGHLPPSSFDVTIRTSASKMAFLLFSTLMTGYMYHGAWQRLCLDEHLGAAAPPPPESAPPPHSLLDDVHSMDEDEYRGAGPPGGGTGQGVGYAPGSQHRGVTGEVLRWHLAAGQESMPAGEYIRYLERELERHRQDAAARRAAPANALLEYVRAAGSGAEGGALSGRASAQALQAMTSLVQRSLGGSGGGWHAGSRDCPAEELTQQLYWLAVVGWQLRALEFDTGRARLVGGEGAQAP